MCVRTLAGGESNDLPLEYGGGGGGGGDKQQSRYLSKVKEKYIRMYDEMMAKEQSVPDAKESTCFHDLADDILSASTVRCSVLLNAVTRYRQALQQSKLFKILFRTTQPAHVITIAAVLCVTSALVPMTDRVQTAGHPHSRFAAFVYLAAFVVHFGAQIWMTFVSGLSLYFALPRHTFGEVQRVLFPRYFTINACLSLVTLLIFIKHHPTRTWDTEVAVQVCGMSAAFFLELLIRLYLTPPLLKLMVEKNKLERAAGVGSEVGRHNPGPLKYCPHYLKIHGEFRRVHVYIAAGNMLTMGCAVLHLQYIASKLCVL